MKAVLDRMNGEAHCAEVIDCKFALCQRVRLIHDPESLDRMVTQVFIGAGMSIRYELSCGDKATVHYEQEIVPAEEQENSIGFRINFVK